MAETDEGIFSNDSVPSDNDSNGKCALIGVKHLNGLHVTEKLATGDNPVINKEGVNSVVLNGAHKIHETGDNSKSDDQNCSKFSSHSEKPVESEDLYSNGIDISSSNSIENGRKSSFLLAKARDSLKDIQAKFRTTPYKTDTCIDITIQEPEIKERFSPNHIIDAVEENGISDDVLAESNESTKKIEDKFFDCDKAVHESENTVKANGSSDENANEDENNEVAAVKEDLNKEEILDMSDELDLEKKENVKEEELLGSSVEEGIHMEIGSDNEDDLLMTEVSISENSKQVGKTSPVSNQKDVCVSFDEDSNSNMNSDKVNDAIKLLSHDLSGTQSPVPSSEQESQENKVIELNDSDLDVNKVNEKLNEVMEEASEHLIDKDSNKEDNSHHMKTETMKNESKEVVEISPEKSPRSTKYTDELENTEESSKNDKDDDDDLIFEGELKVNNSSKETHVDENNKILISSCETDEINIVSNSKISKQDEINDKIKSESEDQNEENKEINAIEINDDDDVIFEKETKIDKNTDEPHEHDKDSKESIPMDISKEIISNEKTDLTTVSNGDLNTNDSKTCDNNDRKRPAEEMELQTSASKRSKLNESKKVPPAKDSKKVEQPTSIELSDSDEDSDSSSNESNVPKSRETYLRLKRKKEEKKMITITKKELEDLVRTKVKEYLASQRDKLLTQLSQKCQDFQSNNDLWKRQVKDLQVKVNDVTVLQQKHEKRKAHTAALRQITTRNVGVQVDDGRMTITEDVETPPAPKGPCQDAVVNNRNIHKGRGEYEISDATKKKDVLSFDLLTVDRDENTAKWKGGYKLLDAMKKKEIVSFARANCVKVAARHIEISRSSISDWLRIGFEQRNERGHLPRPGKPLTYSNDIEQKLLSYVLEQIDLQCDVSIDSLCSLAKTLITPDNPEFKASHGWADRFMKRHDHVLKAKTESSEKYSYLTSNAKQRHVVTSPVANSPTKLMPKAPQSNMAPVVTAPPGANGMIRLPIPQSSLPLPVLQQSLPQTPQIIATDFKTPTVKSLLGTTRTQPTISSVATTSGTAPVLSVQYPQRVVTHTPTTTATFITLPTGTVASTGGKVVKTAGNTKIIDLTDDEPSRMIVSIPQAMSGVATQTGVQTIISPTGSQIVRPGTFQLVLGPGTQPLRPGTIVTGLPQTFIQTLPGTGAAPLNANVNPQPSQPVLTTVTNRAPPPLQATPPVSTTRDILPSLIHPAPFPPQPSQPSAPKAIPPKPSLRVSRTNQGIVLSWNMVLSNNVAEIASYQLFAYQETSAPPNTSLWKKVGDVKALPLPMACTLTQFQVGNKYHFAVRALDIHGRVSLYSDPSSLHMTDSNTTEK